MQSRVDKVLKSYLSLCEPEKRVALEAFLPEEESDELESSDPLEESIDPALFHDKDLLNKVHWSWFLPTLKLYPESEQKLFIAALDPYAEKSLAKALTLSSGGSKITKIGKSFLQKVLTEALIDPRDPLLPVVYLPKSTICRLLQLTKKQLTHLIDQLSLYDFAIELRQIVETKILKKIYSLLTDEEKKRLRELGNYKESFSLGRLGIEKWDGSEEILRTLLHKRGLARLGAGLSGQDPDFIWYICHQLDIGRGSHLQKLCKEKAIHGISDVIVKQIEELL